MCRFLSNVCLFLALLSVPLYSLMAQQQDSTTVKKHEVTSEREHETAKLRDTELTLHKLTKAKIYNDLIDKLWRAAKNHHDQYNKLSREMDEKNIPITPPYFQPKDKPPHNDVRPPSYLEKGDQLLEFENLRKKILDHINAHLEDFRVYGRKGISANRFFQFHMTTVFADCIDLVDKQGLMYQNSIPIFECIDEKFYTNIRCKQKEYLDVIDDLKKLLVRDYDKLRWVEGLIEKGAEEGRTTLPGRPPVEFKSEEDLSAEELGQKIIEHGDNQIDYYNKTKNKSAGQVRRFWRSMVDLRLELIILVENECLQYERTLAPHAQTDPSTDH